MNVYRSSVVFVWTEININLKYYESSL